MRCVFFSRCQRTIPQAQRRMSIMSSFSPCTRTRALRAARTSGPVGSCQSIYRTNFKDPPTRGSTNAKIQEGFLRKNQLDGARAGTVPQNNRRACALPGEAQAIDRPGNRPIITYSTYLPDRRDPSYTVLINPGLQGQNSPGQWATSGYGRSSMPDRAGSGARNKRCARIAEQL